MATSPLSVPRTANYPDIQMEQRGKVTANQNLGEGAKENSPLEYSPAQIYLKGCLRVLIYICFTHITCVCLFPALYESYF